MMLQAKVDDLERDRAAASLEVEAICETLAGSLAEMADVAHRHGKKFGYVMTTGVQRLGPRLADAGVDLLYFVDPDLDEITLEDARELFGDRMTVAGGMNSRCLACGDPQEISGNVQRALEVMGSSNRFILHPTDAIFPDTPFEGVMEMIAAWKKEG